MSKRTRQCIGILATLSKHICRTKSILEAGAACLPVVFFRTVDFEKRKKRGIEYDFNESKMRASTELDNLLEAGTYVSFAPDGANNHSHPNTNGFEYY